MRLASRLVLGMAALAAFALAQDIRTGTLVGLVTDSSGSAVPQARVTVINVQNKVASPGIIVQAGSTVRIDVPLEVGAVTQEIEVMAASPLLATDSAVLGMTVDAKRADAHNAFPKPVIE